MSQVTVVKRSLVFAAATAMSAAGLLTLPAAQAEPMFPLAPACYQWSWNGNTQLKHTNGWDVTFDARSGHAFGSASATHPSGGRLQGTIDGDIFVGGKVDFQIRWDNGAIGHYTGHVGDDGIPRGATVDLAHPENKAQWWTVSPAVCPDEFLPPPEPEPAEQQPPRPPVQKPPDPKPAEQQPPPPPPETVGVSSDTNVYDKPSDQGGQAILVNGENLFLDAGVDQVNLVGGCSKQTWCTVTNPKIPLPNNTGAVWGGDLEVPGD